MRKSLAPGTAGAAVRSYDFKGPVITLACTNALVAIHPHSPWGQPMVAVTVTPVGQGCLKWNH